MARLAAFGVGAVEPDYFGIGPVPAVKQALARAGWSVGDLDRVEINEAFAAIALACQRELGLRRRSSTPRGAPSPTAIPLAPAARC
jgi:acetyl-CoA C-acetyltransferase